MFLFSSEDDFVHGAFLTLRSEDIFLWFWFSSAWVQCGNDWFCWRVFGSLVSVGLGYSVSSWTVGMACRLSCFLVRSEVYCPFFHEFGFFLFVVDLHWLCFSIVFLVPGVGTLGGWIWLSEGGVVSLVSYLTGIGSL